MSIVSGSLGAVMGSNAQRDAARRNEASVTGTNAANVGLDLVSRGAAAPRGIGSGRGRFLLPASVVGTSSAVLPYYFGASESNLANASTDLFNASFGLDSTHSEVPTASNARYVGSGATANIAADRAALARAEAELTSLGTGSANRAARGRVRERINELRNQLVGATAPQSRSGVNPGVGTAINDMIARDAGIVAGYEPQVAAGDQLISDLYSGDVTDAMLAEAKPVQDSRIRLANMERDAGIEALQDKLNEIRTIQAKKGFTGDSLAQQRLEFDARRRIGTDSARARGGAELENAQETQRIQGAGRDLQFRSLDVPFNRAGQRINLANLPAQSAQQRFSAAMAPMNFFRIGGANFQVQGPPERSSVPSAGQIALTGLGSANSTLGRAVLDRYGRPTNTTPTMPPVVEGPNGQSYFNTGSSYQPVVGAAAAAGGAAASSQWYDDVIDSIAY